jgi:cell division protein FtsZ
MAPISTATPAPSSLKSFHPEIKVIGVGGGGGNVIARMIASGIEGVHLIAANTDAQALRATKADHQLLLGRGITGGRGAGSHPEVGEQAAEESRDEVVRTLEGAAMVFIAAGMGGGTGTGAAPLIAKAAKQRVHALTVAVVTLPFTFEGKRRMKVAREGLAKLRAQSDVVLVIPNDRLLTLAPRSTAMVEAFKLADQVLVDVIQGVSDLVTHAGLINVDLADVRTIMEYKGGAVIGKGTGSGDDGLRKAAEQAVHHPLMGSVDLAGAKGVLAHVIGSPRMSLIEVQEAMDAINKMAGYEANVIFGATTREEMGDNVSIILIVTGLAGEGAAPVG